VLEGDVIDINYDIKRLTDKVVDAMATSISTNEKLVCALLKRIDG
jgi:hypothetical protein